MMELYIYETARKMPKLKKNYFLAVTFYYSFLYIFFSVPYGKWKILRKNPGRLVIEMWFQLCACKVPTIFFNRLTLVLVYRNGKNVCLCHAEQMSEKKK